MCIRDSFGIEVDQIVGKLSDGEGTNVLDLIRAGEIAFVILSLIHISEPTRPY